MRQLTLVIAACVAVVGCEAEPVPDPLGSGAPQAPAEPWSPPEASEVAAAKACYGPVEAGVPLPPPVEPEIESVEGSARDLSANAEEVSAEALGELGGDVSDADAAERAPDVAEEVAADDVPLGQSDDGGSGQSDVVTEDADNGGPTYCPTCQGEPFPHYVLADFQPQSCSYRRAYGLDSFKGRPTVAVLLAAW